MKKIKMWDWYANKFRSSKIFNRNRKSPSLPISKIVSEVERLEKERVILEQKDERSPLENERLREIRKEVDRLANTDTGERYRKFDYGDNDN